MVTHHTPALSTPYYADSGDGTMLHRYLDEQFVNRFNQEAANGPLMSSRRLGWTLRSGRNWRQLSAMRVPDMPCTNMARLNTPPLAASTWSKSS